MQAPRDSAFVASMLDECRSRAVLITGQEDLTVVKGPPGSGYSFNFLRRRISLQADGFTPANAHSLRHMVCHEAGHALITAGELIGIQTGTARLGEAALREFQNCVEDARVERYLLDEGLADPEWMRETYRREVERSKGGSFPKDPPSAFLTGLLLKWSSLSLPQGIHPDARSAIERCWDDFVASTELVPSRSELRHPDRIHRRWALHQCSLHHPAESPWHRLVLMEQHEWWRFVEANLLPVFEELVAKHGDKALRERHRRRHACRSGRCEPGRGAGRSRGRDPRANGGVVRTHADAVAEHGRTIDRLCDALLQRIQLSRRLKQKRFQPEGNRLDMKVAMQFCMGDRDALDRLWIGETWTPESRMRIHLLVDRSASMNSDDHAPVCHSMDGSVVFAECALRLGIPMHVFGFGIELESYGTVDKTSNPNFLSAVERLGTPADQGGTDLLGALDELLPRINPDGFEDLLVVITDGAISEQDAPDIGARLDRFEAHGGQAVVLVVADCTPQDPRFRVVRIEQVPELMGQLLQEHIFRNSA